MRWNFFLYSKIAFFIYLYIRLYECISYSNPSKAAVKRNWCKCLGDSHTDCKSCWKQAPVNLIGPLAPSPPPFMRASHSSFHTCVQQFYSWEETAANLVSIASQWVVGCILPSPFLQRLTKQTSLYPADIYINPHCSLQLGQSGGSLHVLFLRWLMLSHATIELGQCLKSWARGNSWDGM